MVLVRASRIPCAAACGIDIIHQIQIAKKWTGLTQNVHRIPQNDGQGRNLQLVDFATPSPCPLVDNLRVNDGCVVARSAEAKALGVKMGVPWFKIREEAQRAGIVALSSNYALYADLSDRVTETLRGFSPDVEVYSIDESFLDVTGFCHLGLEDYGGAIRKRVAQWVGMAVCVGFGESKTLAKLANHCAKKGLAGADGVCDLTALEGPALDDLFSRIPVGEVWGVGRRISAGLAAMGVETVLDLRDADAETVRSRFSVALERTVRELRGVSCLALEEMAAGGGPGRSVLRGRGFQVLGPDGGSGRDKREMGKGDPAAGGSEGGPFEVGDGAGKPFARIHHGLEGPACRQGDLAESNGRRYLLISGGLGYEGLKFVV